MLYACIVSRDIHIARTQVRITRKVHESTVQICLGHFVGIDSNEVNKYSGHMDTYGHIHLKDSSITLLSSICCMTRALFPTSRRSSFFTPTPKDWALSSLNFIG